MPPDQNTPAAPAAAPAPAAGAAPAPAAGAAAPNALQAGAPAPTFDWMPEKYRVAAADGKLDMEASAKKLADGYANAVKRIGTGDLPPESADKYAVTVPDEFKEAFKADDKMLAEFRSQAHAKGLTQGQFDFVLGEFFKRVPALAEQQTELARSECEAELRKSWPREDDYRGNLTAAFRAATAYGGPDAEALIADYGNDPRMVRLLAAIGKELREDSPPADSLPAAPADIDKRIAELQDAIPKLPRADARRTAMQSEFEALMAKKVRLAKQQR